MSHAAVSSKLMCILYIILMFHSTLFRNNFSFSHLGISEGFRIIVDHPRDGPYLLVEPQVVEVFDDGVTNLHKVQLLNLDNFLYN